MGLMILIFMFKEDYNNLAGIYSYEFSLVDSEIPHLYANVDVYLNGYDYIYDTLDILYIEIVEVNGNKYLVSIGNTDYTFIDGMMPSLLLKIGKNT